MIVVFRSICIVKATAQQVVHDILHHSSAPPLPYSPRLRVYLHSSSYLCRLRTHSCVCEKTFLPCSLWLFYLFCPNFERGFLPVGGHTFGKPAAGRTAAHLVYVCDTQTAQPSRASLLNSHPYFQGLTRNFLTCFMRTNSTHRSVEGHKQSKSHADLNRRHLRFRLIDLSATATNTAKYHSYLSQQRFEQTRLMEGLVPPHHILPNKWNQFNRPKLDYPE